MCKRSLALAGVLAGALAWSGCSRPSVSEARAPSEPAAAIVPVVRAAPADLSHDLTLAAEFRPYQEIEVHAKVAGYVKSIGVDVGDHVRMGQWLATLEIPEQEDELARVLAEKMHAEAEVTRARSELERARSAHQAAHLTYQRLFEVLKSRPNLVAQQEIDDAQARDRVGEAQVETAIAALAGAQQAVLSAVASEKKARTFADYSRITAPFAGVITKRYADTGAMIQAGTASQSQAMPLVRLSQNDRLRLVLPVPESAAARIRIGGTVEVRVPSLDRSFAGRVARFAGRVQTSTRTMETEVDVPNPSQLLIPGMYATAALTFEKRDDALAVPVEAVAAIDSAPNVLIVASGRIEERSIRTGIETSTKVEVLSGLRGGDLVVVGSRAQFRPGQTVTPKVIDPRGGK